MSAPPASETPPARGSRAAPAYASAPRRSGLLVALACVVALAAAGALAMFLFGATAPTSAMPKPPSDEAREAMAAAKSALDEASKSVLQPQGASAPAQDAPATASPSPEPARPEAVTQAGSAPVAVPPAAAPAAAPAEGPRPAPKADAAKVSPPRAAPAPKAAPAAPEPVVVAAAPASAPSAPDASVDRWVQMKAEIAKCWGGSVLGLQCERRVRVRYCEGYWGSVPECTTGRTDHGN